MLSLRRFSLAALVAVVVLGSALAARATQTEVFAVPFAGDPTSVHVLLDDAGGDITVTLTVNEGLADLRGFFLNIADFSLLSGLDVTGDDVTSFQVSDDAVIDLGHGANLHGGGSPCPCDIGVEIGTSGIGMDDIFQTSFVLDADADLVLDDFAGELLGVRVTSVGTDGDSDDDHEWDWGWKHQWRRDWKGGSNWASNHDSGWHAKWKEFKDDCKRSDHGGDHGKGDHHGKGHHDPDKKKDDRDGSAKLVGQISDPIVPIPEPSPALLTAIGLGGLACYAARRQPRR